MRIRWTRSGSLTHIPGLSGPMVMESDQLTNEEAAQLQRLLAFLEAKGRAGGR